MTAVYPARTGLRWGQIYGVDVQDHDSWMIDPAHARTVVNDYIGQTRQKGRARENQHRDSQAFADLIVGSPRILWEGWCTDAELDEKERRFIQDVPLVQRPRLNFLLNEDNPHRIPKYKLKEQRHIRDQRRGEQLWEPTDYQPQAYGYRPAVQVKPRRPWSLRRKHLTGLAVAWLALTLAGWITIAVRSALTQETGYSAPVFALVVTVWAWLGCPVFKPQRRKAKARFRRRLQLRRKRR